MNIDSFQTDKSQTTRFQLVGMYDKPTAILKCVMCESQYIYEFKFRGYECCIRSCTLSENDIENINTTCTINILSMTFNKKNDVFAVINYNFYTFEHKKRKERIQNFLEKEIDGFYGYEIVCGIKKSKKKIGPIMNKYIGAEKSIYALINMLSDSDVINILGIWSSNKYIKKT